jgi:hypothetical protein
MKWLLHNELRYIKSWLVKDREMIEKLNKCIRINYYLVLIAIEILIRTSID